MNWGDCKKAGERIVHRKDIDWVTAQELCCSDISSRLVVQENEAFAVLSPVVDMASGYYKVSLPPDYARMRGVRQSKRELNPYDAKSFQEVAQPLMRAGYLISGGSLWTVAGGAVNIVYSARLLPMGADDETNIVLTNYPSIFLYGLVSHAAASGQDFDGSTEYDRRYETALAAANDMYLDAAYGPGAIVTPVGGVV